MKEVQKDPTDVGVIIGRFQIDALHEAHIDLIQHVQQRHKKVIIFLGLSPAKCTVNNPLDFEARKQMIQDKFPDINILYIKDTKHDDVWSNNLDGQIKDITGPNQTVTLYGGRDSFIKHYSGQYGTAELMQEVFTSGTARRRELSNKVKADPAFRHGVIWSTQNQYPKCFPTVDIAILTEDNKRILLGRKKDEKQYRFIGGFVNPGETFEEAAVRESKEETSLIVTNPRYLSSFVVDDWRYRSEVDKITTSLFLGTYSFGKPTPGDDIYEVKWFDLGTELIDVVVDGHKQLMAAVLAERPNF